MQRSERKKEKRNGKIGHCLPQVMSYSLLAPQSGALRISAYRDFQSHPIQPIHL